MKLRPLPPSLRRLRLACRRAFAKAMANGAIARRDVCQRCGRRQEKGKSRLSIFGVEAHHSDYSKPLDVEWLCHWCHMTADNELRDAMRLLPSPDDAADAPNANQTPVVQHAIFSAPVVRLAETEHVGSIAS